MAGLNHQACGVLDVASAARCPDRADRREAQSDCESAAGLKTGLVQRLRLQAIIGKTGEAPGASFVPQQGTCRATFRRGRAIHLTGSLTAL